jgi:hypothetical protein
MANIHQNGPEILGNKAVEYCNLIHCQQFLPLTPKIRCAFLPNCVVFDIVGNINFSKNKSMQI